MIKKLMEQRVNEMMIEDQTNPKDKERISLFHIIAGNEELWSIRKAIYDSKEHSIIPEVLESGICSSSKTLVMIAFNLYNNYPTDSLMDCLSNLDTDNYELVMAAIRLRLNKNEK